MWSGKATKELSERLEAVSGRLAILEDILGGVSPDLLQRLRGLHELATSSELEQLSDELASTREAVGDELNRLRAAVADGIEDQERREKRIRATVGRARADLRRAGLEHAGLEAEAHVLGDGDGARGEGQGVPPVPNELGADPPWLEAIRTGSIPGQLTADDFR